MQAYMLFVKHCLHYCYIFFTDENSIEYNKTRMEGILPSIPHEISSNVNEIIIL